MDRAPRFERGGCEFESRRAGQRKEHEMNDALPALPPKPIPTDVVKEIAMDIGKATAAYIEVMYPDAVKATSSTFLLSLRNHIYNEIMAALDVTDENDIRVRLDNRKIFRRKWKAQYKKIRNMPIVGEEPATR
jgi:hypothetical protein